MGLSLRDRVGLAHVPSTEQLLIKCQVGCTVLY